MTVPIAHAGHWATNILYVLPVIVLFAAAGRQRWRDRADRSEAERQVPDD